MRYMTTLKQQAECQLRKGDVIGLERIFGRGIEMTETVGKDYVGREIARTRKIEAQSY